ncbi:MAG: DUF4416 family protein [Phycisphaerae bacterium]
MGAIRPAPAAKLICGILAVDEAARERAVELLNREFGDVELRSAIWPFTWTDYYEDEMGPKLLRQIVAFSGRFRPETIVAVKIAANRMESELATEWARRSDRRPVNLDPGYVTEGQLILATTKPREHRVYLGEGIHAECTLRYQQRGWKSWPWTYPDYASETYHAFLTDVRNRLRAEIGAADAARPESAGGLESLTS